MPVEARKYSNADEMLDNLTYDGLELEQPILIGACRSMVNSLKPDMESRSGVPQMVIGFTTEEVCKDMDGNDAPVGTRVIHRINLGLHDNVADKDKGWMEERNRKEAASFMSSALGVKYDKQNPPKWNPLDQYVGKSLVVRYDKRPDKKDPTKFYQDVKGFNATA